MKQLALILVACLWSTICYAQPWPPGGQGIPVVCAYNSSPPTIATGNFLYVQCSSTGSLLTSGGGGGGGSVTQGTIPWVDTSAGVTASGASITENPLADGGRAQTTNPTAVTDGQKVNLALDKYGRVVTSPLAPVDLWVSGHGSSTTTAAITLLAASGSASLREWLRAVHCGRSDSGSTAITVAISDGTTTVTEVVPNSGGGGGNNLTFDPPIPFAANTAVTGTPSSGVSTLYCDAQGYNAP